MSKPFGAVALTTLVAVIASAGVAGWVVLQPPRPTHEPSNVIVPIAPFGPLDEKEESPSDENSSSTAPYRASLSGVASKIVETRGNEPTIEVKETPAADTSPLPAVAQPTLTSNDAANANIASSDADLPVAAEAPTQSESGSRGSATVEAPGSESSDTNAIVLVPSPVELNSPPIPADGEPTIQRRLLPEYLPSSPIDGSESAPSDLPPDTEEAISQPSATQTQARSKQDNMGTEGTSPHVSTEMLVAEPMPSDQRATEETPPAAEPENHVLTDAASPPGVDDAEQPVAVAVTPNLPSDALSADAEEVVPPHVEPLTWMVNARPFDRGDPRPRIAIVVTNLGLSSGATNAAIQLPGGVTLAFASYAQDLQKWIDLARAGGHEVMLDLPMEPSNYPVLKPGPQPLLTSLTDENNLTRLQWHLGRATGIVGVTNNMGSRFTSSASNFRPVLEFLDSQGLLYVDSRTSSKPVARQIASAIGIPHISSNRFLDAEASRTAIDKRLEEVAEIARDRGVAVALCHAFPVTIERLSAWLPGLDAWDLALAPVSAVVESSTEP